MLEILLVISSFFCGVIFGMWLIMRKFYNHLIAMRIYDKEEANKHIIASKHKYK